MIPLVPLAIGTLTGLVIWKKASEDSIGAEPGGGALFGTHGASGAGPSLSPDRQAVYETALNHVQDPAKLRKLSEAFSKEGFHEHAVMLAKRAKLREMPKELRKARRAAYKATLRSKDKEGVLRVAKAYHQEGASGSALALYKYADGL